jgi:type II secretory pathway pseudopilin PulG
VRRRRGSTLAEALLAAALIAFVGAALTEALAAVSGSGARAVMNGQARRIVQYDLEMARAGRAQLPAGTSQSGPFTISVSTQPAQVPSLLTPPGAPTCSPCSAQISSGSAGSLTQVSVTVRISADGTVAASGSTVTPY